MLRRAMAVLGSVLVVLSLTAATRSATVPPVSLRILAIGDSLNSGYGSPDGCGYRTELGRLLTAAGVVPVWTGPQRNGGPVGPNDCLTGYRFGATVQVVRDGINGWMASDNPDVVIILVGTNNAAGVAPGMVNFGADYRDLVTRIYAAKPTVKVIVPWIPYSAAPWAGAEVTVNTLIYTDVVALVPSVLWVNLSQYPTRLLWDGVHPSDYDPIARLMYAPLATAYGLPAGPQDSYALPTANCRPGFERTPTAITC